MPSCCSALFQSYGQAVNNRRRLTACITVSIKLAVLHIRPDVEFSIECLAKQNAQAKLKRWCFLRECAGWESRASPRIQSDISDSNRMLLLAPHLSGRHQLVNDFVNALTFLFRAYSGPVTSGMQVGSTRLLSRGWRTSHSHGTV